MQFKNIILALFLTITLSNSSDTIKNNKKITIDKNICSKNSQIEEVRRRGCCSWHGGVSGCSNGRIVCNDGSYSPSCTCVVPTNPLG